MNRVSRENLEWILEKIIEEIGEEIFKKERANLDRLAKLIQFAHSLQQLMIS